MKLQRSEIEELFYGSADKQRRFTQDFPILPDVWFAFGEKPHSRFEVLLTPNNHCADAATLGRAIRARLAAEQEVVDSKRGNLWKHEHRSLGPRVPGPRVLFNESVVLARFSFWELVRVALPLTDWWAHAIEPHLRKAGDFESLLRRLEGEREPKEPRPDVRMIRKLVEILGAIDLARGRSARKPKPKDRASAYNTAAVRLLQSVTPSEGTLGMIWTISRNREADTSVWRSRIAIKSDAAARLFDVQTSGIRWAVLDTGIDARHNAFARRDAKHGIVDSIPDESGKTSILSRVLRTYEFLRLKDLLDPDLAPPLNNSAAGSMSPEQLRQRTTDLEQNLKRGKSIDWELLEPFLRVPHTEEEYVPPTDGHGTHVAGILAADWPEASDDTALGQPLRGICPDLEVFDLRVLGKGADEFTIIAALQFVRHLNAHRDLMLIHGVNLSMSVQHDVTNYACGRTPVCEECERVVASGVVVVTAAGNRGFNKLAQADRGSLGDYRYISITDPGNAESVITVGSTHRYMPHTYGVSYFSSRGPTGDGRTKPDLVAPGERIDSCTLDQDVDTRDGTSMAAPHVSGAAALLLGRHRELMGQPKRIKEILVRSATDLGREPRFQGGGMLDVLRALQSV